MSGPDVSDLIEEHGIHAYPFSSEKLAEFDEMEKARCIRSHRGACIHAYPFSPEKLTEFDEMEKARLEAQTLESLLVDGEHDFVIIEDGIKAWTFLFPLLLDVKL